MTKVSIITWVNNREQYQQMKDSVTFEAEFIEVGQNCHSMAEAYNLGTKLSTGMWKIYCHQDVRFFDEYLPEKLAQLKQNTGFVGVVGSAEQSIKSWWDTPRESWRGRLIQGNMFQEMGPIGPVRNLDGLLLATDKIFKFPEELPGIHFLDMWMCRLAEEQGLTNWVIPTIVRHLSQGSLNAEYHSNLSLYREKWLS